MNIILVVVCVICMMISFVCGFFQGMATMKKIDDNIIEETKKRIYGEE